MLTVPRGATTDAGAKAYEMKLPNSPIFIREKPSHLESRILMTVNATCMDPEVFTII